MDAGTRPHIMGFLGMVTTTPVGRVDIDMVT
jgi:hypothetical protein